MRIGGADNERHRSSHLGGDNHRLFEVGEILDLVEDRRKPGDAARLVRPLLFVKVEHTPGGNPVVTKIGLLRIVRMGVADVVADDVARFVLFDAEPDQRVAFLCGRRLDALRGDAFDLQGNRFVRPADVAHDDECFTVAEPAAFRQPLHFRQRLAAARTDAGGQPLEHRVQFGVVNLGLCGR